MGSVTVEMKYFVCKDCGATYGYPSNYYGDRCPFCLMRDHNKLLSDFNAKSRTIITLHNSVRGLNGAMTRLRNQIKELKNND